MRLIVGVIAYIDIPRQLLLEERVHLPRWLCELFPIFFRRCEWEVAQENDAAFVGPEFFVDWLRFYN
jgi:hypothetical protein